MTRPGDRLRALAQRICSASAMERLIDPAIADLQHEYDEARRRGGLWRGRRILIAGYIAVWKVAAIGVCRAANRSLRDRSSRDGVAIGRAIRSAGLATTAIVGLMIWAPLRQALLSGAEGRVTLLVVYLIPQALSVAMPLGFMFGALYGLKGRVPTQRSRLIILGLAVAVSLAAIVLDGWLLPAANQAYRELIAGRQIVRGMNELTLVQLASTNTFQFHFRIALAVAPLGLGLLSLAIATATRGRLGVVPLGVTTAATAFAYYAAVFYAREAAYRYHVAVLAAWSPDLVVLAVALLLRQVRLKPDTAEARTTAI